MRALIERSPNEKKFDCHNKEHLRTLETKINQFNCSLEALKNVDMQILKGIIVGSSCWIGSYLLPTATLSTAGFCWATHHFTKRQELFIQYKESLSELCRTYDWCMKQDNLWHCLRTNTVQNLILTLGPWVSVDTIKRWKEADRATRLFGSDGLTQTFQRQLEYFEQGKHCDNWAYSLYSMDGVENFSEKSLSGIGSQIIQKMTPVVTEAFSPRTP